MPKITIITPTYNSSKFIKRTIASVLAQTYTAWEYLLIDDHSTDNTLEIITEISKQDSRIKILQTPKNSGGPALPKNIGIQNAQGEYIAFLDHDDEWLPEKLEKQLAIFEKPENQKLGLVSCYMNIRDSISGEIISKYKNLYKKRSLLNLQESNFLSTSSCIMTKLSILKEIGPFDTNFKVSDDWDMWLRILQTGYKLDFIPEYLINYFRHQGNLSSNIEVEINDLKILTDKNKDGPCEIKNSIILSYYYFNKKNYKQSRKYCLQTLFSKKITFIFRVKSLAYILFTFLPPLRDISKKVYNMINNRLAK